MFKVSTADIEERHFLSAKNTFGIAMKNISASLAQQLPENREAPVDVGYCVLASGERNFPYHFHATAWEIYFALKGHALVRTAAGVEDFKAGANTSCRPGDAHQIINYSGEEPGYERLEQFR